MYVDLPHTHKKLFEVIEDDTCDHDKERYPFMHAVKKIKKIKKKNIF